MALNGLIKCIVRQQIDFYAIYASLCSLPVAILDVGLDFQSSTPIILQLCLPSQETWLTMKIQPHYIISYNSYAIVKPIGLLSNFGTLRPP